MEDNELLKKYFYQWLLIINNKKKIEDTEINNEKINLFLERLMQYKKDLIANKNNKTKMKISDNNSEASSKHCESSSSSTKNQSFLGNYQHRFQAQKNIIALQKVKLKEQQRFIEELKLNRLVEDAGYSGAAIIDVRKTLSHCEKNVKPKLKCIVGECSPREEIIPGESFEISCMKIPKLLQKMEQRAREREEKRAVVTERRRQMELERERIKEQQIISRQLMDQEEKNKRMNEFKEKRRQEQLIAIRNKQLREKIRALTVMADLHYEKKLIVKYGIQNFKLYVIKVNDDFKTAVSHYDRVLCCKHFYAWRKYTCDILTHKNNIASNMYNLKIIHWVFHVWKAEYKVMVNKRQVAEDWYDLHITERLFIQWHSNILQIRKQRKWQWNLAVQHSNMRLKWRIIGCWQTLPTINAIEREHEARKQRWREKVQQVLPDFIPREMD